MLSKYLYRAQFNASRRHHWLSGVYAREGLFDCEDEGPLPLLVHTPSMHLAAVLRVGNRVPEDISQRGSIYWVVLHLGRDRGTINILFRRLEYRFHRGHHYIGVFRGLEALKVGETIHIEKNNLRPC
jgi:hypothetical protein